MKTFEQFLEGKEGLPLVTDFKIGTTFFVSPGFPVEKDTVGDTSEYTQVYNGIKDILKMGFSSKLYNRKLKLTFSNEKDSDNAASLLTKAGYKITR